MKTYIYIFVRKNFNIIIWYIIWIWILKGKAHCKSCCQCTTTTPNNWFGTTKDLPSYMESGESFVVSHTIPLLITREVFTHTKVLTLTENDCVCLNFYHTYSGSLVGSKLLKIFVIINHVKSIAVEDRYNLWFCGNLYLNNIYLKYVYKQLTCRNKTILRVGYMLNF